MGSYEYEKTHSFVQKKKELIFVKKYLLAKDKDNQKYAIFHLINNYKEAVTRIVLVINQYDKDGNFLARNEVPYDNLNIKSHGRFVPFFKLVLDDLTERIETQVIGADFENHKYENGHLYRVKKEKKPKEEKEIQLKDSIDKDVKTLKSSFPFKSFMIISLIVLLVMGIFIGVFSLSNPEIMYRDMAFNTSTGVITKYYGDSKNIVIPEKIKDKEVKEIKSRAFMNKSMMSVTIKSSEIVIGDHAFANCQNLVSFYAKDITKIGNYAFEGCSYLEVLSFNSIKEIGEGAFKSCRLIETFSCDACEKVGLYAFNDCFSLKEVSLPKAQLQSMVFLNNDSLTTLEFGDIEEGNYVTLSRIFSNIHNAQNVAVTCNLKKIESEFFEDFSCKKINFINPDAIFVGNAYNDYIQLAKDKSSYIETNQYIKAFDVITEFKADNISDNLTIFDASIKGIIANNTSSFARNVRTLNICANIVLTKELLSNFTGLTSIELQGGTQIENGSIVSTNLTSISMPVIGESFVNLFAFMPFTLDVEIVGNKNIPAGYFNGASSVRSIKIGGYLSEIGKNAISNCPRLERLVIESNVKKMDLPIVDNRSTSLSYVEIPFIGTSINEPSKYLALNESGGFTTQLVIKNSGAITFVSDTFDNCTMISYLDLECDVTGENQGVLTKLTGLNKLVINGFMSSTLGDMRGNNHIESVSINTNNILAEFFGGCYITNIFFNGNIMLRGDFFTANDFITNIYLSSNSFKGSEDKYEDIFDKIIALDSIYFERSAITYEGTKNIFTNYNYQEKYDGIFN